MKTASYSMLLAMLVFSPLNAAEMRVNHDLRYVEAPDNRHARHRLDVYSPAEGRNHPIMVWLHGGGWRFGDKRSVQEKPQAFVDRGFVFVSVNYRFVPEAAMDEIAGDVAAAIRWTREHAAEYGGDPNRIFIGGHSAGAHLAALVCTDPRYLTSQNMKLAEISGCIPVDSAVYDAADHIARIQRFAPRRGTIYTDAFGGDAATQRKFSPSTYVEQDRGIPPFCLLYVANRPDSARQSSAFAAALAKAGVEVALVPGRDKTHASINRELGQPEDQPTARMFEFLQKHTN